MLSSIFLIETNRFLSRAVELAAKEQGVSCYTTDLILDCFYLIRDLNPQVIVISASALIPHEEQFFSRLFQETDHKNIPLVLLGDETALKEVKHKKHFMGEIVKPIAPFEFKDKLEMILKLH